MASNMHFHILCICLLITTGIELGLARTLDVPTSNDLKFLCYTYDNRIEDSFEDCQYGSYNDTCGRRKCYGGPGDECKPHDENLRCHAALECSCNKCIGCLGNKNCYSTICPSTVNLYSILRKRFERIMRGLNV